MFRASFFCVLVLMILTPLAQAEEQAPKTAEPLPKLDDNANAVATTPATVWELADERAFSGRLAFDAYHPFYVLEADPVGKDDKSAEINWHHYSDEPLIAYHPDQELLLDSSRVLDRWVRLSKQTPHTVKWELKFHGAAVCARLDPDGVALFKDVVDGCVALTGNASHILIIERAGNSLSLRADDKPAVVIAIKDTDRTPLRVVAQVNPALLESTKLYFGKGEKLSPPPVETGDRKAPRWTKVFAEDFATAESLKSFSVNPEAAQFEWKKADQSLAMGPAAGGDPDQAYVLIHKSLPGDLRMQFRARSTLKNQPAFFGLLVSINGRLRMEDGYFVEWNYWQVQIKKKNTRMAGREVSYPEGDANRWMTFKVEKIDGEFTMYTEGKEVLKWRDPHPLNDAAHDLLTFYSWHVPMEFKDVLIERNQDDAVQAQSDDPATPDNYLQGVRTATPSKSPDF